MVQAQTMSFHNFAQLGYGPLAGRWDLGEGMRLSFELPDDRAENCTIIVEGPRRTFGSPPADVGARTHGTDVVTTFLLGVFGAPLAGAKEGRFRAGLPAFALGGAMATSPLAEAERHPERLEKALTERGLLWILPAGLEALDAGPFFYSEEEGVTWWEYGIVIAPAGPGMLVFRTRMDVACTTLLLSLSAAGILNTAGVRTAVLDRADDILEAPPEIV